MSNATELARLNADLERVRATIATIETDGAKSFSAGEYGGENVSLDTLYRRERTLMVRVRRLSGGNIRVGMPVR